LYAISEDLGFLEDAWELPWRLDPDSEDNLPIPLAKMRAVSSYEITRSGQDGRRKDMPILGGEGWGVLQHRLATEFEDACKIEKSMEAIKLLNEREISFTFRDHEIGCNQFHGWNLPNARNFALIFPGDGHQDVGIEKKPDSAGAAAHAGQRTWSMESGSIPMACTSLRACM